MPPPWYSGPPAARSPCSWCKLRTISSRKQCNLPDGPATRPLASVAGTRLVQAINIAISARCLSGWAGSRYCLCDQVAQDWPIAARQAVHSALRSAISSPRSLPSPDPRPRETMTRFAEQPREAISAAHIRQSVPGFLRNGRAYRVPSLAVRWLWRLRAEGSFHGACNRNQHAFLRQTRTEIGPLTRLSTCQNPLSSTADLSAGMLPSFPADKHAGSSTSHAHERKRQHPPLPCERAWDSLAAARLPR